MPLPRFEPAATLRPFRLAREEPLSAVGAPYVTVLADGGGPARLALASGEDRIEAHYDGESCWLEVTGDGRRLRHWRPRHARPRGEVAQVALTLTGSRATLAVREDGRWTVRAVAGLRGRLATHDEAWLAALSAEGGELRGYGELGLRDLRLVSHADGTPYLEDGRAMLTATSAGPGFFNTAHTSVWALDPDGLSLEHRSDVFFRRPDRPGVYGDHASHLVRDGDRWLMNTSTWGDFDPKRKGATVGVTLAETTADLLAGRHVLDTRPLSLPTTGFSSVGVWDPHLVRVDGSWLVAYVSARRFFRFHPVLAAGTRLDDLSVLGAATELKETEGSTLLRVDGAWRLLASDGVDKSYPVFDLGMRQVGRLEAPYPSNIPWPTLLPTDDGWLLVGFDGEPAGGPLAGYGTHGSVRVARSV